MAMFDDLDLGETIPRPVNTPASDVIQPPGDGDLPREFLITEDPLDDQISGPNRTGGGDVCDGCPPADISGRRPFDGASQVPSQSNGIGQSNGKGKRHKPSQESNGDNSSDPSLSSIPNGPPSIDLSLPSLTSRTGAEEAIALTKWRAIEAHLTKWFHDFDMDALKIAFATMVSHQFSQDDPVWIFIVGPAGTGKTVVINMISALPRTTVMGDLTPQTLLSGFNKGKGYSLLNTLGDSFVLLFKDFTTFLSKRPETRGEIASQLREVYDGKIARNTGASKGLTWSGKCTTICAVTPAVERAWTLMRDLGERFCTVRWPRGDGPAMAEKSMAQLGRGKQIMDELKEMTVDLWNCVPMMAAQIPDSALNIDLIYLAEMVSHLRGHVQRNAEGKHEISEVPEVEGPTRLAKAFTQVARGHASLMRRRTCTDEDLRLARRLALDTIPSTRRRVWEGMLRMPYSDATPELLEAETTVPLNTVKWVLEDFAALGIVKAQEVGTERKDYWFTDTFDNIQKKALPKLFEDRERARAEARERRKER